MPRADNPVDGVTLSLVGQEGETGSETRITLTTEADKALRASYPPQLRITTSVVHSAIQSVSGHNNPVLRVSDAYKLRQYTSFWIRPQC